MSKVKNAFHDEIEARHTLDRWQDADAEATQFAMELMMPEECLRADLAEMSIDIDDIKSVHKIAMRYKVSDQVMALRIGQITQRA